MPTLWSLEAVNITLYGERDFANVIKIKNIEVGRLFWFIWVDPI